MIFLKKYTWPLFISSSLALSLFSCASSTMIKTQPRPVYSKKSPSPNVIEKKPVEVKSIVSSAVPTTVSSVKKDSAVENVLIPPSQIPIQTLTKPVVKKFEVSEIRYPTQYKKIGVVLPLTGKNAHLGQRALSAIRIGFNIGSTDSGFSLALFDTQSKSDLASQALDKLVKEDHVIAVIGGLNAKEATLLSEKAEFYQVPLFTFSQKSNLTEGVDYTFRNSVTPAMQVSKLVEFAIQKSGMKKFAILYPNDSYGIEFANRFWDQVLAYGGSIVAAQTYQPKDSDLTSQVQKMVGTFYLEDRPEEYQAKLQEISEKRKKDTKQKTNKISREHEAKENMLPPLVDFDAIFIPDSSRVMGQAIAFFKNADVDKMTYLGTNLWNTEDLIRRAGSSQTASTNSFYFTDTVFTEEEKSNSDFNKKFISLHNEEPSIIEVQTYEAAKILYDLISRGTRDRYELADKLKELGRRTGAYTEIYMNNSNELVRPLSILTLHSGQIRAQE